MEIKERKKILKWLFLEGCKDFSMDFLISNGGCSKFVVLFSVDSIFWKRGVEEEDIEVFIIISNFEGKRYKIFIYLLLYFCFRI